MHEVHIYDGVVLGKRGVREADALLAILTPAGLLRASARSSRAEKSKLRYGLEPLSRGRYSLVRGRHEWRLIGVTDISRTYLAAATPARAAAARVARLLLRLVAGTEPNPELFQTIVEGFDVLASTKQVGSGYGDFSTEKSPEVASPSLGKPPAPTVLSSPDSLEVVLVLRILSRLGYLPHTDALAPFVEGGFDIALSAKALEERALLVRTINESLQATGL